MSDLDLAMTGKDISLELVINGIPIEISDAVVSFDETPVFDDVIRKHIGTNNRDIDKIPVGWDGNIVISAKTRAVENALDAYITSRINRIPVNASITVVKRFRNGQVKVDTYVNVQFSVDSRVAREDAVEYSLAWMSGRPRISI